MSLFILISIGIIVVVVLCAVILAGRADRQRREQQRLWEWIQDWESERMGKENSERRQNSAGELGTKDDQWYHENNETSAQKENREHGH